jgi:hypothetical protein
MKKLLQSHLVVGVGSLEWVEGQCGREGWARDFEKDTEEKG